MKNLMIVFSLMSFLLTGQIVLAQVATTLTEKEKSDIQYLLEKEKLARDIFLDLNEKWDHTVFSHIANSKQRHFDKTKALASQFNLTIQSSDIQDKRGAFQNTDLQKLYKELTTTGITSLENAFRTGARIEELNIIDLRSAISNSKNPDILNVFQQLEQASQKHLLSFTKNLKKEGIQYQPILLNQSDYDVIVSSENSCNKDNKKSGAACCSQNGGDKASTKGAACCNGNKSKETKKGNCNSAKKSAGCCSSKN